MRHRQGLRPRGDSFALVGGHSLYAVAGDTLVLFMSLSFSVSLTPPLRFTWWNSCRSSTYPLSWKWILLIDEDLMVHWQWCVVPRSKAQWKSTAWKHCWTEHCKAKLKYQRHLPAVQLWKNHPPSLNLRFLITIVAYLLGSVEIK